MMSTENLERELLLEVGKVTAIIVYNPEGCVLAIKRPKNEEWKPGKWSPPVGHIEEGDVRLLLELARKDVVIPSKEQLYLITGHRELGEEISHDVTQTNLRYVGQFHDDRTGYDVTVVAGVMITNSLDDLPFRTPQVSVSEEASNVRWFKPSRIRKLSQQGTLVGYSTYKMVFKDSSVQRMLDLYR